MSLAIENDATPASRFALCRRAASDIASRNACVANSSEELLQRGLVGEPPRGDAVDDDLAQLVGPEDARLGHVLDLFFVGVDVAADHAEFGCAPGDRLDRLVKAVGQAVCDQVGEELL